MQRYVFAFLLAIFFGHASAQFPKQVPNMGGGGVTNGQQQQTTQVNPSNSNCAQLRAERDAINQIGEKMQWVPIEQQNANYHRMNQIKRDMSVMGCAH